MVERLLMATSWVVYPTKETTKVPEPLGTLSEKLPVASVEAPLVVPFSTTVTPGKPSPVSDVTLPLIARFWAQAPAAEKRSRCSTSRYLIL
jgi:hypothetical protein